MTLKLIRQTDPEAFHPTKHLGILILSSDINLDSLLFYHQLFWLVFPPLFLPPVFFLRKTS